MEHLRFIAAGSVDDGKSSLIGRLLYDTGSIHEDQLADIQRSSQSRKGKELDFSFFTDGLKQERDLGITVDIAYRFFSTTQRRFTIIDCPGHFEFLKNMVTGASHADAAVILVDAFRGLTSQTWRHIQICRLLNIESVFCVNKMDQVGFSEEIFNNYVVQLKKAFPNQQPHILPVSAIGGDNVVRASPSTPWYKGPSLLSVLGTLKPRPSKSERLELAIQGDITPLANNKSTGGSIYTGRLSSGNLRVGQKIWEPLRNIKGVVTDIFLGDLQLTSAGPGESISFKMNIPEQLKRGDLMVSGETTLKISKNLDGTLFWFSNQPLRSSQTYLLRHRTKEVVARVEEVQGLLLTESDHLASAEEIRINQIGQIKLSLNEALATDSYENSLDSGTAILIDPSTHETLGALTL